MKITRAVCCMILSMLTLLSLGIISSLSADSYTLSCPKNMQLSEDGAYCTDGAHSTDLNADLFTECSSSEDCPNAFPCCSGWCTDTQSNDRNCGWCGHVCPMDTPDCYYGRCVNILKWPYETPSSYVIYSIEGCKPWYLHVRRRSGDLPKLFIRSSNLILK